MDIFAIKSRIIVTCSNRMSPFVEQEVRDAGLKIEQVFKTGVALQGSMRDCILLNLRLRSAGQVLFSIRHFFAEDAQELYQAIHMIPWEDLIEGDGYFSVTSHVRNDSISNQLFANVKVKDAIVDRFRDKTGARPNSGPALDQAVVHLHWVGRDAEVFIDTSGLTLMKHGYRKIPGKAPMIEALASACILASKWDRQSPFVNPMCGSGTLAIEAALIAANKYPGVQRDNFSFMHIRGYDPRVYQELRKKLQQEERELPSLQIIATDISEDAVNIARINARMAGVEDYIQFRKCDFADTPVPEGQPGVVFFNPEYGDRLGDEEALQPVYKRMGDFLKQKCKGYLGYIFTGNLELAKHIGLKPRRRIEFFNGKIDCRLLEYELYAGSRESKPGQEKQPGQGTGA